MKKRWLLLAELTAVAMAFTQMAPATNRYVSLTGGNNSPYTNWTDAATNIQYAISVCSSGDVVWVTNGTYETGGITNWPVGTLLTNRVALTNAYVTLRSANNDPTNTIIKGAWDPATNGPAAVRCLYMADKTTLIGFTLTNGATLTNDNYNGYGGGIFCDNQTGVTISNCVFTRNSANYGGGIFNTLYYRGALYNCALTGNVASNGGGGIFNGILYNCTIVGNSATKGTGSGGGANSCTLYHSLLTSNSAFYGGGGYSCTMYDCLVIGNKGGDFGGGTYLGTLYNCTLVGNSGTYRGGGVSGGVLYNCIVYFNTANAGYENWNTGESFTNCCTTPAQGGWASGNITNDPTFVANGSGYGLSHIPGNYRLRNNSPGLDTGTNFNWMTNFPYNLDLDGRKRIQYGTVDMGAYERLNAGTIYKLR